MWFDMEIYRQNVATFLIRKVVGAIQWKLGALRGKSVQTDGN